jgi:hypothetical protein
VEDEGMEAEEDLWAFKVKARRQSELEMCWKPLNKFKQRNCSSFWQY